MKKHIAVSMAIPFAVLLLAWLADLASGSGMFPYILTAIALMWVAPAFWIAGNLYTTIVLLSRPAVPSEGRQVPGLYWAQCAGTALMIGIYFFIWVKSEYAEYQHDLRNDVIEAIRSQRLDRFLHALDQCGSACSRDHSFYEQSVLHAISANAPEIYMHLRKDSRHASMAYEGYGAPYLSFQSTACNGTVVINPEAFAAAVLSPQPQEILKSMLPFSTSEHKQLLLRHAIRFDRLDVVQFLAAAGADMAASDYHRWNDPDASLLSLAVEHRAVNVLQWLLANGHPVDDAAEQGVMRKRYTLGHTLILAAHEEQRNTGGVELSARILGMLLASGASMNVARPDDDKTPFQLLIEPNVWDETANVVKTFIAKSFPVPAMSESEKTKFDAYMNTAIRPREWAVLKPADCAEKAFIARYGPVPARYAN